MTSHDYYLTHPTQFSSALPFVGQCWLSLMSPLSISPILAAMQTPQPTHVCLESSCNISSFPCICRYSAAPRSNPPSQAKFHLRQQLLPHHSIFFRFLVKQRPPTRLIERERCLSGTCSRLQQAVTFFWVSLGSTIDLPLINRYRGLKRTPD